MTRALNMSLAVSSQFESNNYEEDLHGNRDQFAKQGLTKYFEDDGLILNAADVIPLLTNFNIATFSSHCDGHRPLTTQHISGCCPTQFYNGDEKKFPLPNIFDTSQKICKLLYENNLFIKAFQHSIQVLGSCLQHFYIVHGIYEVPESLVSEKIKALAEHVKTAAVELIPKITVNISRLECDVFWKALQYRHVDHDFALGMLCTLPSGSTTLTLQNMKEKFGTRHSRIETAAKVGRDFAALSSNQKLYEEFKTIESCSVWGKRLQAMKIPCKDICNLGLDDKTALLKKIVSHKDTSLELLNEFVQAFSLEKASVYLLYLKTLLLPQSSVKPTVTPQFMENMHAVVKCLQDIGNSDLLPLMNDCIQRVSPYDYERLIFVLGAIRRISPQPIGGIEKGIRLLEVLTNYERKVSPSHTESTGYLGIDEDEFLRGDKINSSLAEKRLPFHSLMDSQPWKLIMTELVSEEAVIEIEPIVKALGLSVDQLYSVAIHEIGTKAVDGTEKSAKKRRKYETSFRYEAVENLLKKIVNPEMLIAAAKWVAKILPLGEGKVKALSLCVDTAKTWGSKCGPQAIEKVKETYVRFNELLKRIHTETILLDHSIRDETFLSLCNQPATLICRLYEDFGTVDSLPCGKVSEAQDVNKIVSSVADINDCALSKLEAHLLEKWLLSSTREAQSEVSDHDVTMQGDVSMLISDDCPTSSEEDNLKRVVYMLKGRESDSIISTLMALKSMETSYAARYSHKIRSMQALFSLVPASIIEKKANKSLDVIREEFVCFVYLRELEGLHMSQSVSAFCRCNKEGLVKGLWRNHNHERKAVRLISDLCIDFKIYDPHLWNVLLPQLLSFGMIQYLTHVLVSVSGVSELRELPCLPAMWKSVINAPLLSASPPLSDEDEKNCIKAADLLQRCPVILSLDVCHFYEQFKRLELFVQALMCLSLVPDMRSRESNVTALLEANGCEVILSDIKKQRAKYGSHWQVDEMEEEIYQFIEDRCLFAELYGTEYFQNMIAYLIKTDQLGKLVLKTLQLNRLKNAIQLVLLYFKAYPQHQISMDTADHTLNEFHMLTMFLENEGLLTEAAPFLPISDDEAMN